MIRYAVGTVLLFYFLGADVFARYRPPVLGDAMHTLHSEINRGTWRIVGPSVMYVKGMFASQEDIERNRVKRSQLDKQ
jgi:hypothetical protein